MRSRASLALLALLLAVLFAGFLALGTWQVQRRAWKLDLIDRVEQRVHSAPVSAPGREAWSGVDSSLEYLAVRADGVLLNDQEVLVQAVTERGPGFWVLTPLKTDQGFIVLINRGFVDTDHRDPASRPIAEPSGQSAISGLLRPSEPGGGFLHRNNPAAQRWYSRDVAAIAAAQKLPAEDIAPYFIDADASPNPGGWPIGGLTVVRFHNSHLVYAITWYALALMALGAAFIVGRQEWVLRRRIRYR